MFSITDILNKLIDKTDLNYEEMKFVMTQILLGNYSPEVISAILIALRVKNESIEEILASVEVLRNFSIKIPITNKNNLIDIVGTGGDKHKTFNISTACCFIVSAMGARVVKHGGRSVSSRSGAVDIFEKMGANINLNANQIEKCLDVLNMAFINSSNYHLAMKKVNPIREKLKVRTIFNILGPLINPTSVLNQLLGVFHIDLIKIYIEICKKSKLNHVMVVHGKDGLDEVSIFDTTYVAELKEGEISYYEINPDQFGIPIAKNLDSIRVNSSLESLKIIDSILEGSNKGCSRDIVILNSAVALYCANIVKSIDDGILAAKEAIDSGKAKKKKQEFINYTNILV